MNARLLTFAALAVFGLGAAALADPPKAAPSRDTQDFVYLGDKGPVLLRFHVQIDGKPLMDVWENWIGGLFAYLDSDGDGVLSKEEAARVPPVQQLFNNAPGLVAARPVLAGQRPGSPAALDKNRDGKVTREELADWYRRNGAAPFQFSSGNAGGPQQLVVRIAGQPQPLSADALNEKLFNLLDANKDGKLSREELTRAPALLRKLDLDDDEMVSVQEMSGNVDSDPQVGKVVVAAAFTPDTGNDKSPFVLVTPGEADKKLAQKLLQHYGPKNQKGAAQGLSRKDLNLDEETFARLDADEDGVLDAEELARFAQRDPDLEFRVRIGKKGAKEAAVELIASGDRKTPLGGSVRPGSESTVTMEFGSTQIQLGRGDSSTDVQFVRVQNQQYLAQFRQADKDNNGYLDKQEAQQSPFFRNLFAMLDRDGDGKLYEKEVVAYLDKMKELQEAALRSCASLAVKDQGRGLFDLVDSNSDGRLGTRELRRMVQLIDQLDRDGDGQISRGEIPHKYRVDVRQGPASGNQFTPRAVAIRRLGTSEPALPELTAGPRWFRKMDRNHDGDVSRREFLGTDEEFRRIDTDGDGLISPEEADRADKLFRKDRP
jgi:Ca2+-binding EF-hand superfamily protein